MRVTPTRRQKNATRVDRANGVQPARLPATRASLSIPKVRASLSIPNALIAAVGIVVIVAVLLPVILVILTSISSSQAGFVGDFTVTNLREDFATSESVTFLANTLIYTVGGTIIAVLIAGILAWITSMTNAPFSRLLSLLAVTPLLFPPLLLTTSWVQLYGGSAGYLNVLFSHLLGRGQVPLNVESLGGMIVVAGLNMVPIPFLIISSAMRSLNPALVEASSLCGASTRSTVVRIVVPLLRPAILSSSAIVALVVAGSFEIPFIIGLPGGIVTLVSAMYNALSSGGVPNYNLAGAQADLYFVFNGALLFWYMLATRNQRRFVTVAGRGGGYRIRLGRWRWMLVLVPTVYAVVAVLQLLLQAVLVSFQSFFTTSEGFPYTHWTLTNYVSLVRVPGLFGAFTTTLIIGGIVTFITVIVAVVVSHVGFQTRVRGRRVLEGISTLPIAIPPVVFSIALLITVLIVPGLRQTYETLVPIVICEVIIFLPFAVRAIAPSMIQLPSELREAASLCGARRLGILWTISLPLIRRAVGAAALIVFVFSFRELAGIALLTAANATLVSQTALDHWQDGEFGLVAALNILMVVVPALVAIIAIGLARIVGRLMAQGGAGASGQIYGGRVSGGGASSPGRGAEIVSEELEGAGGAVGV